MLVCESHGGLLTSNMDSRIEKKGNMEAVAYQGQ